MHSRYSDHVQGSSNQAQFPSKSTSLWRCRLLKLSTPLAICSVARHVGPEMKEDSVLLTLSFQSSNSKMSTAECCGTRDQGLSVSCLCYLFDCQVKSLQVMSTGLCHTLNTVYAPGYLILAFFNLCSPGITLPPLAALAAMCSPRALHPW